MLNAPQGINCYSQRIQNVATPTSANDAATKTYVDQGGTTARYTAAITATGANQPVAAGTSTPLQLLNARRTSSLVSAGGTNNNTFTLAAGQWNFFANVHLSVSTSGEVFVQIVRNDSGELFIDWYNGTLTSGKTYDINLAGSDYISPSTSVNLYVVTTSPAAGSIASGTAATGIRTYLAMQWMGS
jgi:hypothetical protein